MCERRIIEESLRKEKLAVLADAWGMTVDELLAEWGLDSVVPGICTNDDCEYTTTYEPDQDAGWCEVCDTPTVASALILAELI